VVGDVAPVPVSIVIPARDAEATLRETIASLRAQTARDWEAVLVDDGSTDGTRELAAAIAEDEPRLRVLHTEAAGVGAARNLGLAEARHDRLLFLDADDLLRPTALARLGAALDRDPELVGAPCGWARLAPDGRVTGELEVSQEGDLFAELAFHCVFPIHACLVRTELVRAVGGFDPGLATCEDWDLWLRLARLGRPFAAVPEVLALYRMRERSASVDGRRMLEDGLEVLQRARRADPRVVDAAPARARGWQRDDLAETRLYHACWTAGLVLGSGGDARELLEPLRGDRAPGLGPEGVAHSLFVSGLLPRCLTPTDWPSLWPELEERTTAFLAELEATSGALDLARTSLRALERRLLGATRGSGRLGSFQSLSIDVARPIRDVRVDPGVERLLCQVEDAGAELGLVELPVCDGIVPAEAIADAVASELAWPILGSFLAREVYPQLALRPGADGVSVLRGETVLATGLPAGTTPASGALHDAVGWTVLLQELFGLPHWPPEHFYDWYAVLAGSGTERRAAVELSEALPDLEAPGGVLDVDVTIGGAGLGTVRVLAEDGLVHAGRLVVATITEAGFELARVAVRESVLDRREEAGRSLRDELALRAIARRGGDGARPDGGELVLCRRRPYELGGAASRATALPASVGAELIESAAAAGEAIRRNGQPPRRARYDPRSLAPQAFAATNGSRPGEDYFESLFAERADPWDYTNPYERTKYRQTLDAVPGRVGRALELGCAEGHFTEQLAGRVGELVAADISQTALDRARARCAGFENVEYLRLDVATDPLPGGFDLIVCSEILYYLDGRPELDAAAARLARALRPGGRLVTAHAHVVADQPGRPGFAWDVPFGARTIGIALQEAGGLELETELRTPFYRVQRFRRPSALGRLRRRRPAVTSVLQPEPLPIPVASTARWEGIDGPAGAAATSELPILMYHRIASGGSDALDRYRLAPERFAEQLRSLREAGFRSVGFEEVGRALRGRRSLPGRAIALTFDDGCRDFLTDAWPLLREHGFGATLFVVTDRVGGVAEWDAAYGAPVELLDWDELRRLARAGVEIGSHTATHPHLTALPTDDVAREAARSRATLIRELGVEPAAIAYPYGDVDAGVRRIAGGVGYGYGLTTEPRRASLLDDPLGLPRIEVTSTLTADDLRETLGL
jgi:peptidoglycan/xylan/chitin deacetylase (PgdA/CDA1 family)/glycosyltransferase involved in cell wall biosynthesis/SAM-dependent methyltransferase